MEKKLQRDTQHKVIGGVCAGLANYFDIDVSLVRLLFAVMLVFASMGFWLYLILWIVMPAAIQCQASAVVDAECQEVVETNNKEGKTTSKKGMAFGLVLIVAGACFLLGNLVPQFNWRTFWPILLIIVGILLVIPVKKQEP